MSNKIQKLAKKFLKLNVLEIKKILDIFSKKYNININNININSINNNNNNNNDISEKKENKKLENNIDNKKYKLIIKNFGNSKLSTIRLIKDITNLSLIDSKKLIDNIPSVIKDNLSLIEIKNLQNKFKNINVETEIK
ncbi:MAG: ribosomal protein L7/L12 [Candidatus Shikimatogenerans sp. Tser]|uniref:Ribosomal protein L7/L12 n=1 Tax=Candidatus Shikimatogenerans sp. Tser TaxID=3158568 RepID=A0AAU7QQL6_9FLAO